MSWIVAVAQRPGQAQLILGVGGVAGKGGSKRLDGVIIVACSGVAQSLRVELAAARLLVKVISGNEVTDGGKSGHGSKSED